MTTHVLFLCPHSAGKSVLAATYFRAEAARLGLQATASVAGTDPDDEVMPVVREALAEQGLTVSDRPRAVTVADVDAAAIVVSIGCDLEAIPASRVIEWDAPMLSDDVPAAVTSLQRQAEALARSLA